MPLWQCHRSNALLPFPPLRCRWVSAQSSVTGKADFDSAGIVWLFHPTVILPLQIIGTGGSMRLYKVHSSWNSQFINVYVYFTVILWIHCIPRVLIHYLHYLMECRNSFRFGICVIFIHLPHSYILAYCLAFFPPASALDLVIFPRSPNSI